MGRAVAVTYAPRRVGDVEHSLADITAAGNGLGYRAAIPFREGLERTIAWYAAKI